MKKGASLFPGKRPSKREAHNAIQFTGAMLDPTFKPDFKKKAVRKARTDVPREDWEQMKFVKWAKKRGYKVSHIPSGTYSAHYSVRNANKATGLAKGVPDVLLILPGKLCFVEMKRARKSYSTVSKEQKEWLKALDVINGVYAFVAYGYIEAIEKIEKILDIDVK